MSRRLSRDIERIIRDGTAIDRAIVAAHRRVVQRHRQLGVPLAIWRGGQVVEAPPRSTRRLVGPLVEIGRAVTGSGDAAC